MGQYCSGDEIAAYGTLQAAKAACLNNFECGCIDDYACDGDGWWISKGNSVGTSPNGACTWTNGKLTCPIHTRKLINVCFDKY